MEGLFVRSICVLIMLIAYCKGIRRRGEDEGGEWVGEEMGGEKGAGIGRREEGLHCRKTTLTNYLL